MRFWLALLLIVGLAGCDVNIQRGGIEPPPKEYRGRGPAEGVTVTQYPTRAEVQAACEARGMKPEDLYGHGIKVRACYDPKTKTVFIIQRGKIPDYEWLEEWDHEASGHGNGLIHNANGRGWKPDPNLFAQKPAVPVQHDWSNVFATPATPPAGRNVFRGR